MSVSCLEGRVPGHDGSVPVGGAVHDDERPVVCGHPVVSQDRVGGGHGLCRASQPLRQHELLGGMELVHVLVELQDLAVQARAVLLPVVCARTIGVVLARHGRYCLWLHCLLSGRSGLRTAATQDRTPQTNHLQLCQLSVVTMFLTACTSPTWASPTLMSTSGFLDAAYSAGRVQLRT